MIKTLLTLFVLSSSFLLQAQNVNFKWAKQMGGIKKDALMAMALDAKGNIYTTGSFQGTGDFDPDSGTYYFNAPPYNKFSTFISKLDSNGKFIWAKQFVGECTGKGITVDNQGNIYILGNFKDSVDFDPGYGVHILNSNNAPYNTFLAKLDSSGGLVWVTQKIGNSNGQILVDSKNNIYVGFYNGSKKIDSSGNLIWSKSFPFVTFSLALDTFGNVYYTGYFGGVCDFDLGSGTHNLSSVRDSNGNYTQDAFVLKMDSSGKFQWAKQIGGIDRDAGNQITIDSKGNICISGFFKDSVDFDPGAGTYYLSFKSKYSDKSTFILKLDSSGNFLWAKSFNTEIDLSITTDNSSNIYGYGLFAYSVDFDAGLGKYELTSAGIGDLFILKLDGSGNFIWVKQIEGDGDGLIFTKVDAFGNVYSTGTFDRKIDFDFGRDSFYISPINNSQDIFIHKMSPCSQSSSTVNITACNSFSFKGNAVHTVSGTYNDTIINYMGCDSLVTLNLTIKPVSGITLKETACNSYQFKGNTITQSGVYYDTLPNYVGCDSVVVLDLTVNYSSSSTINGVGCNRYYFNGNMLTTSGVYVDTIHNTAGCDSIITLNLSIHKSNVITLTGSDCKNYVFNGKTYTASGVYTDLFTNMSGCDSVVTLNLTINPVDVSVTKNGKILIANANNASYQWLDCTNGNAAIAGETNKSFLPTVSGDYAARVIQNGCTDTSVCYTVNFTGIGETAIQNQLTVFPNPTNGVINIQTAATQDARNMVIFNAIGQAVYKEIWRKGETSKLIDISQYAKGIYFIQLGEAVEKIIVE